MTARWRSLAASRTWHFGLPLGLAAGAAAVWLSTSNASGARATAAEVEGGDPSGAVAFVGVNVLSMLDERPLENQTVIVRGDRIVEVGAREAVHLPADVRQIDARGRFLMPGLADMHVHLEHLDDEESLVLFLAAGVTTVRHMDGRPRELEWRRRVAEGSLLGPTIHMAGKVIDARPRPHDQTTVVGSPGEASAAIRDQAAAGYDFVKVYDQLPLESYLAIVDTAAELGLQVAGHVPDAVGLASVLAAKQTSIEHLDGYPTLVVRPVAADSSSWRPGFMVGELDARALREWAARTAAAGTWNCPTLVVKQQAVPLAAARALLESDRMRTVWPSLREGWNYLYYAYAFRDPDEFAMLPRGAENRFATVRALRDAGAPLLAGTDTPHLFVEPGPSLHRELATLVNAGLSPYEALRAATSQASRFLGSADEFGVVRAGARADLVLLSANPLADIAAVGAIEGVAVRGRWMDAEELRSMVDDLVASYGEPSPSAVVGQEEGERGSATFGRSYLLRIAQYPLGEERVWVRPDPGGSEVIRGSATYDEPDDPDIGVRIQLDGERRELGRDFWLRSPWGVGSLHLTKASSPITATAQATAAWTLEGTSLEGEPVQVRVEAPPDSIVVSAAPGGIGLRSSFSTHGPRSRGHGRAAGIGDRGSFGGGRNAIYCSHRSKGCGPGVIREGSGTHVRDQNGP